MCLYSFVVPVYNVKHEYLKKCLDSILQNEVSELEVVIVDDHSSNGCERLCDQYCEKEKRIKVYHLPENQGVSNARNFGVARSTGEWVIFVDSDDWIESDLCTQLNRHIKENADIIVFSAFKESVNNTQEFGAPVNSIYFEKSESNRPGEHSTRELCDCLLKQSLNTTDKMHDTTKYCWGKAFRRQFLISKNILFSELNYCEDIVYMYSTFQQAAKVIVLPERLYHYRVSSDSAVNSFRKNALREQQKFLDILNSNISDQENDTIYYAALLSMQICLTRYFFNRNNHKSLLRKHIEASEFFKSWPYSDVFMYVDYLNMRKSEKTKALLIKWKLYYAYYIGTEIRKLRAIRY